MLQQLVVTSGLYSIIMCFCIFVNSSGGALMYFTLPQYHRLLHLQSFETLKMMKSVSKPHCYCNEKHHPLKNMRLI